MERPKGFKKEFTMDNPPNFEEISRRNPLQDAVHPEHYFQPNERPGNGELMSVNDEAVHEQAPQNLSENALGSLMIQPVNPLLIQMQQAAHLRELWVRQQLVSAIVGNRPATYGNRNQSIVEDVLLAHLMNQMQ